MKNNRNSTVLITGGAGFIGSHLVDRLLLENYRVTVLDNLSNGKVENLIQAKSNPNFKFIKGDILQVKNCLMASQGTKYIFHLACLGVRHSIHSPLDNHRVNAEGTLNMLMAALKNKVSHFFYISSSEIYGNTDAFPITEKTLPQPTTIYGSSKLVGENYTQSFSSCYGLKTTIIRLFNNYGPRAHYEGDSGEMIPRSIIYILNGKSPTIFGNGRNTRDFIYVKDTVNAIATLLNHNNSSEGLFNMGYGKEISMIELVQSILKLTDKQIPIKFFSGRPGDIKRLWVKPNKFNKTFKFKPQYSFDQGLRETITYYRELMKKNNLISGIKLKNWR
jgi:UDP-glucose 4-epimerase